MVIFLHFSVSGNAISIVATHISLFNDFFAFISFKSKKTRLARKSVSHFYKFSNIVNFQICIFLQFIKYKPTFITVSYWTLLVL